MRPTPQPPGPFRLLLAVLVALLTLAGGAGCRAGDTASTPAGQGPAATSRGAAPGARTPSGPQQTAKGGATVRVSELPKEAQETMALIDKGGPFPYDRDGIEFQNREGRLPRQPGGWYKEYTVKTPGSGDRGARRIIVGKDDRRWYTADHYETFQEVRR